MSNKKVAVLLSGCGVFDGAEINEVVLTLLALENNGFSHQCFAPDIQQHHVIDHKKGDIPPEIRNVFTESARIVRGNIKPVTECNSEQFAAVIVPGGFGVAKNLSNFATGESEFRVEKNTLSALKQFAAENKPAGYMCIAPILIPSVYGPDVKITIGNDGEVIEFIKKAGCQHQIARYNEIVVDETRNVVTTPAYMLAQSIKEAKEGIDKLVEKVVSLL
ncbi:isoprenoid biosynthesis glyoxalase ElbB [Pantoea phytobeneficialis]|uniref:Glyoxalase n=1 Tax=Pantoea phytobeneficialis TaxID=2052056 RepID=A0AAP9H9B2_9GAMM|nr:isoprenoid biosynthesis glyoxalase ElbB [Pantoea phytobeneficialis]MDO6409418.1 isoprenoid biosynthesis glyoxalase ElbB [Pantoea phytobeneficialis]QGR08932.1 isoprenoid biosynthesis protein ElbB [Pantoea phytobeneficialis]